MAVKHRTLEDAMGLTATLQVQMSSLRRETAAEQSRLIEQVNK